MSSGAVQVPLFPSLIRFCWYVVTEGTITQGRVCPADITDSYTYQPFLNGLISMIVTRAAAVRFYCRRRSPFTAK
jgi:hypothetical protein